MSNLTSLGHEPASKAKSHLDRANDLLDEAKALLAAEAREPEAPVRGFWRPVSWPVGSTIDQNTVAYGSEDDLALFERSRIGSERTTWVLASPKPGDAVTVLESILGPGDVVTGAWIGRLARRATPLAAKIAGRVYWIARCTGPSAKQVLVLAVSHDQVFTAIRRQGHDGSEPLDRGQHWLATRVEDDAEVQGKFDKVLLDDGTMVPLSTVIEAQVRP